MTRSSIMNRFLGSHETPTDEISHPSDNASILDESVASSSRRRKPSNHRTSHGNGSITPHDHVGDDDYNIDGEDMKLLDVVTQLIPYYNKGDSSTDSNLRAALSGLSTEEIDTKDEYGSTLLLLACSYQCEDLVRIMLNKGADPCASNNSGTTCLHFCCHKDTQSIPNAKILIMNGANPDVHETQYGCTPLHYCASSGCLELCKLLISKGALTDELDYYNYSCIDYARDAGYTEVMEYLQQKSMNKGSSLGSYYGNTAYPINQQGEWSRYVDPASGYPYYLNSTTGETLWEADYQIRIASTQQSQTPSVKLRAHIQPSSSSSQGFSTLTSNTQSNPRRQVLKDCLLSLLNKHDPAAIATLDQLIANNDKGDLSLLKELCAKYNANEMIELAKYQSKLQAISNNSLSNIPVSNVVEFGASDDEGDVVVQALNGHNSDTFASIPVSQSRGHSLFPLSGSGMLTRLTPRPGSAANRIGLDPHQLQAALGEERMKCEKLLSLEREKYEVLLNQERIQFASVSSEKDMAVSRLQHDLSTLNRDKQALEV